MGVITVLCAGSSVYSIIKGPYYDIKGVAPIIFSLINILAVCFFIFIFSRRMVHLVIEDEIPVYSMPMKSYAKGLKGFFKALFSWSVLPVYGFTLISIVIIGICTFISK